MDAESLHGLLVHYFEASGLSQIQLANRVGKSASSVSYALREPDPDDGPNPAGRYESMRLLLLTELTGYTFRPAYKIEKPTE
ncbi:MAG: hypothetical protein CMM85_18595 [Rhodothermaceae bacterium]|nr:hypothetical protein [Rhodothermaceae bacterium]